MRRSLWLGAGAVAILIVAAIVLMTRYATPPAQRVAAVPTPPAAAKPAQTEPAGPGFGPGIDIVPSFDIVKVDPAGHAVIAGRAAPGAKVHLLDGDKALGDVTADFRGEWVLVPDRPLAPGQHKIGLDATDPKTGAKQTASDTLALVVAPPASPNAAVAVLVPAQGDRPAQAQRVTEPDAPPTKAMAVPTGDSYTVKPGNNLWFLARNSYGEGTRYTTIYQANRGHIRDPDLIYPGQVFLIPKGN